MRGEDCTHRSKCTNAIWAFTLAILTTARVANAASVSAVAGYDDYHGPQSQHTRGAVAAVGVDFGGAQASLAGVRYDDRFTGAGSSVLVGLGVPLHTALTLRGQYTRFFGDEDFGAWRAKVGPQISLAGARTTLSYVRYQDDQDYESNAGMIETEIPLAERWTGRASGSYAAASQGAHGLQGALGLAWTPIAHFEIAGELGAAQEAAQSSSGPSQPVLPLFGSSESSTERRFSPTALVSIRVSAP